MSKQSVSEQAVFDVPERFTIAQAQQAYDKLSALLEDDKVSGVMIKASEVRKVDAAGLQLLLSFCRTADKFHKSIEWKDPSEELLESAQVVGLENELALTNMANNVN